MAIINAVAQWVFVDKPSEYSGKYQVDLCRLDEENIAKLAAMGIEVQYDEKRDESDPLYKGAWVTCKKPAFTKDGEELAPPPVVDANKDPLVLPPGTFIGNGSVVNAQVTPYEWNFKGKKGISANFNRLQVVTLVPYVAGEDFEVVEPVKKETTKAGKKIIASAKKVTESVPFNDSLEDLIED